MVYVPRRGSTIGQHVSSMLKVKNDGSQSKLALKFGIVEQSPRSHGNFSGTPNIIILSFGPVALPSVSSGNGADLSEIVLRGPQALSHLGAYSQ